MASYTRVLVSVPTATRVGFFAPLAILFMGLFIFYLSFQKFFFDMEYAVTTELYFDPYVLDSYVLLTLPCTFMFMFMVSQTRLRIGWYWINFWSAFHLVLACGTIVVTVLYIIVRTEESFAFMKSLQGSNSSMTLQPVINWIHGLATAGLTSAFNDPSNSMYPVCMYLTSYLFVLEFFTALIFTTVSCSMFGDQQIVVCIRHDGDRFSAVVEGRAGSKAKSEAKRAAKNEIL